MKNFLCLILLGFFSFSGHSQNWDFEKPDYNQIRTQIQEEESQFFYADLMDRYLKADTTMNLEQKRHLYYGYIFQPGYSPYARSTYSDSLRTFNARESFSAEDLQTLLSHAESVLAERPFDVEAINYQLFVYKELNDPIKFDQQMNKMDMIIEAIMSSGNGQSLEDSFYVIETTHEYFMLNVMGFGFGGTQSLIQTCDYLTVRENEYDIEGFYFDVSPCLNSLGLTKD